MLVITMHRGAFGEISGKYDLNSGNGSLQQDVRMCQRVAIANEVVALLSST